MKDYLALFDLDGTLFDTGDVNYYAYKDALEPYEIKLDKEYFVKHCNGRHYTEFLPELMGDSDHIESVHEAKKMAYVRNLDKARPNYHLFKMINQMRNTYYLAIVTTASRQNTMDILSYFNYQALSEFIVTQEDISKVKPDPEGFLIAMKHFEIDAHHTLIFEDSDVGVQAAKATGASVFIVGQM